jgi:hypothetical protein
MQVARNAPPSNVEASAQVQFGVGVEFEAPRPTERILNKTYNLRKVTILMKYRSVCYPIQNISNPPDRFNT